MSRTLNTHVSIWGPSGELVSLAPGEDVPEWAVGRVGEHCLVPSTEPDTEPADAESDDGTEAADDGDDGDAEEEGEASDATDEQPNFTAPAPARRGRPRK